MPKQELKKKSFKPSVAIEREFATALKRVARQAGHMVELHVDGSTLKDSKELAASLTAYSKKLGPWAERQAAKMLERVSKKNKKAWKENSKQISRNLKDDHLLYLNSALLLQEQVDLIKAIPLRSLDRAQKLALEAYMNGSRASQIAEELARSGEVSESDAERIARTEVARTNSVITQVRAEAAGSRQYVWRNSGDAAVRESHKYLHGKKLDGQVFSWDQPPTLDDGMTGHPGTFPNCRCYPEPFFPKE